MDVNFFYSLPSDGMFQIQQVKVPEEFRHHATRLMNFLQEQSAHPHSQSVKSGDSTHPTSFPSDQPAFQQGQGAGGGHGLSLVGPEM